MILGINLNHDYAYCLINKSEFKVVEIERVSRIRYHWNHTSYTLSLLDDFSDEELKKIKAIYINTPRLKEIKKRRGNLSSMKRDYRYKGDYPSSDCKRGISYGKIVCKEIEIFAAWVTHHQAHSASAFFSSKFNQADILCLDGGGDYGFGGWFKGDNTSILLSERFWNWNYGHSYHKFSQKYFNVDEGFFESKLMAIASFGNKNLSEKKFFDDKGSLLPIDSSISVHDVAKFQSDFEQAVLELIKSIPRKTEFLVCTGGCFLNVTLNKIIAESELYTNIFVPPFCGDMGTAIGSALLAYIDIEGMLPSIPEDISFLGNELKINKNELLEIMSYFGDTPFFIEE